MTTKSGEGLFVTDYRAIAEIRAKLDLVQKKNCRLKVAENRKGQASLVAINSQGYEVDNNGNRTGRTERHARSSLIEVFQYITAELNKAKTNAQSSGIPADVIEHLKAIHFSARVVYTRSDEKSQSWFSIRHLFARIFAPKQLSDHRQQLLNNIYPLLYQIDEWNLNHELKNQNDLYEIKQQISELAIYLGMSDEIFAESREELQGKVQQLQDKIRKYTQEFPEDSKKELQASRKAFSESIEGSEQQSNQNLLYRNILDMVIDLDDSNSDQMFPEFDIEAARNNTHEPREKLQNLLCNAIQKSPSEPSEGEKQLLMKRLYDYRVRYGEEKTNHLFSHIKIGLKESEFSDFFIAYPKVLQQNRIRAEKLFKIQSLHQQVRRRIEATPSTYGTEQHETLISIEKNLTQLERSLKSFDWNKGNRLCTDDQFSAENMKSLLDALTNLTIGDLPAIRHQFSPLLGLMMDQVADPEKVFYLMIAGFSLKEVPQEITRFSLLKSLTLTNNNLKIIEEGILENFPNLDVLNLRGNQLSKLPSLRGNTILNTVNLCANQFTEVPSSILDLATIETLDMSVNQLAKLPEDWSNLENSLLNLKLSYNQLTEIKSVVQLKRLQKLYCNFNAIKKLPANIVDLPLKEIRLISNQLKKLPRIKGNFQWIDSLQGIDCSHNQLKKLPGSWHRLKALDSLRLASNQIMTIPRKLRVSKRGVVDLANNYLTDVSAGLIYGTGVVTLDNNQIETLPEPRSDKQYTTYSLSITRNLLKTVPSLEPLSSLKVLSLAGNPLIRLPERLVDIESISVLNLQSTPLSWDQSLQEELNKLGYLAASKNPKQFGENARKAKEKRLMELERKSNLLGVEKAERHDLRNDFRPAVLLIEDEAAIPPQINNLREIGKTIFENREETKLVGEAIIDSKISAGGNHYQEDGIVTVDVLCPSLGPDEASLVIAGTLEQLAHKLNDDLQNQNLRYRGDSVLGGMMAAMAVNFQGKFYCRNVGDAQVQVINRQFLEAALNGSFKPVKDVDVDPGTFTTMQDWPMLSLEQRQDFQERGGQLDLSHEKEIRGDKAPTYSTIGDPAWSHIDCQVSEMLEYDVFDYPLIFLSTDGVTDVLSKAEIINIISEMIQNGGNDRESRLANLEKSIVRANRTIRDCAVGKGFNAAAPHDNTAALLMVDKQALSDNEFKDYESDSAEIPIRLLFVFDGHEGNHEDNFVDYALHQIPRYFQKALSNQLARLD